MPLSGRTVFVSADHGLAIVYFLQTDVAPRLIEHGLELVVLTEDSLVETVRERFGRQGLRFEGLRLGRLHDYAQRRMGDVQWWLNFLRRVGGSARINTEAMDSYIDQVQVEQSNWRRARMPLARVLIAVLRRSRPARRSLVTAQQRFQPSVYTDLFNSYRPALVIASTPGWRMDRYLLREAHSHGLPSATVIVGWDNPSSYSVPGAPVDYANCWSELQRQELMMGSDWPADRIHIGGIPIYDGYLDQRWLIPRPEYFARHGLELDRRLLGYACSFTSFAPNYPNVEALARLVAQDQLAEPAQLLVRLHPNHFLDVHLFRKEREQIHQLAAELPHVRVVEPVSLGGGLGYYSGEDMDEKASMMAHSDVFLTVYSTMVVEAAIHDRPIVSVCIDQPGGWNWPRKYSLPLSAIGGWPTHQRFRQAGAGQVVGDEHQLREAVDRGLRDPDFQREARRQFVRREITYTDGSAGRRTADYLADLATGSRNRETA